MNLDMSQWKEFRVGEFFKLQRGHTLSAEQKEDFMGEVPCINGTVENNGVQCKLSTDIETVGFNIIKAPAITIVRVGNGGKTFVQTEDFYIADNAFALMPLNDMSVSSMMFVSALLDNEQIKYSYGRTVTNDYSETIIKLPVDKDDNPDWDYMESYIESLRHKPITTKNKFGQVPELNLREWKRFYLGCLFDIKKGKRLTSEDQEDGDNIYIGAIDSNNGVANHIGQQPIHEGNTISLSYNGSVGEAFYQPEPYWATDDVNALYSYYDGFNKYIGLFMAATIRQEKYRFSYGRKWTLENMKITDICLPVQHNSDGSIFIDETKKYSDEGYVPDWQFMEDYMRSLPYGDRL